MGTTTRADIALIALKANTASLALTASYFSGSITNAVSASYADTASYFSGSITNAVSASYALTASYFSGSITNAVSASYALSASTTLSASVTQNSNAGAQFPLVFVPNSDEITNLNTDSASLFYVPVSNTLFATSSRAISASIADGAVASSTVRVVPDVTTNTFYPIPFASTAFGSAELYSDSSVINFNPSTNRLFITNISSSAITGSSFTGSFTGSLFGTASWANDVISASFAATASFFSGSISNAISASFAVTAGLAQRVEIAGNSTGASAYEILFVDSTGSQIVYAEIGNFYYVPVTDTLYVDNIQVSQSLTARGVSLTGSFSGSLIGTASWAVSSSKAISSSRADLTDYSITIGIDPNTSTNTFYPIPFASTALGNAELYSDSSVINFNPSTNKLFITNISSSTITGSSFTGSFTGSLLGTSSWAISASWAPGGGGTPGGANTNIQFNQLGSFGGDSNFTYNSASALVNIGGDLIVTSKIDTSQRYLIDNAAINSVGWQTRYLYDSTAVISVDWENRNLLDTSGNASMDWEGRYLYSINGDYAFGFDNEIFTFSDFYHASLKTKALAQEGFSSDSSSFAGDIIEANLYTTVKVSDLVYLESTDGKWYQVNQTTSTSTKMLGICVIVSKPGNGSVLLEGHVTVNDDDSGVGPYVPGVDHGLPIYIESGSLASMSTIAPASNYIRLLGHAYYQNTANAHQWIMKFKPDNTWTKI